MNKERRDALRNARPYGAGGKAEPNSPVAPQVNISAPAAPQVQPDVERFIVGIHALDALALKYLAPSPDGKFEGCCGGRSHPPI